MKLFHLEHLMTIAVLDNRGPKRNRIKSIMTVSQKVTSEGKGGKKQMSSCENNVSCFTL